MKCLSSEIFSTIFSRIKYEMRNQQSWTINSHMLVRKKKTLVRTFSRVSSNIKLNRPDCFVETKKIATRESYNTRHFFEQFLCLRVLDTVLNLFLSYLNIQRVNFGITAPWSTLELRLKHDKITLLLKNAWHKITLPKIAWCKKAQGNNLYHLDFSLTSTCSR